jgi:hypothetical protein
VRLFVVLALGWLVVVLLARLLLAGGLGWSVFALALPILLVVLARLMGIGPALLLVALFAAVTLAMRVLLTTPRLGWSLVVLVPVLGLSGLLASRVALSMRATKGT